MTKTLFYPHHPMLDDMMKDFFGEAFGNSKANSKYPLTDVYTQDGKAYMEIAVSGFSTDEITITVNDDILTISGKKANETIPQNRHYIKRDIAKRNFEKSYNLMFTIESIDAVFDNGILTIEITPSHPEKQVQKIEIKTK